MVMEPGKKNPMDNPNYVRLLQLEKEGRTVRACGVVMAIASGAYLLLARARKRFKNPDGPSESN
jgi:hypothetical protein